MKQEVEELEQRCTPAQVWGWHLGTYAWFDNGQPAQDIMPVVVPSVVKAVIQAPTANGDGTATLTVSITAVKGNATADALGAQLTALFVSAGPVTVNASAPQLVAAQVTGGQVNVAWAAWQPGESFAAASLTITYTPSAVEPAFAFGALSPGWLGSLDTSALDAAFARGGF